MFPFLLAAFAESHITENKTMTQIGNRSHDPMNSQRRMMLEKIAHHSL